MAIRPDDEDKMRRALHLPDAMSAATGSDVDPERAAELRRKADRDEAAEQAEAAERDRVAPMPKAGS